MKCIKCEKAIEYPDTAYSSDGKIFFCWKCKAICEKLNQPPTFREALREFIKECFDSTKWPKIGHELEYRAAVTKSVLSLLDWIDDEPCDAAKGLTADPSPAKFRMKEVNGTGFGEKDTVKVIQSDALAEFKRQVKNRIACLGPYVGGVPTIKGVRELIDWINETIPDQTPDRLAEFKEKLKEYIEVIRPKVWASEEPVRFMEILRDLLDWINKH